MFHLLFTFKKLQIISEVLIGLNYFLLGPLSSETSSTAFMMIDEATDPKECSAEPAVHGAMGCGQKNFQLV